MREDNVRMRKQSRQNLTDKDSHARLLLIILYNIISLRYITMIFPFLHDDDGSYSPIQRNGLGEYQRDHHGHVNLPS